MRESRPCVRPLLWTLLAGAIVLAYWKAVDSGADAESLKRRGPNPLWDVLTRALASPRRVAVID